MKPNFSRSLNLTIYVVCLVLLFWMKPETYEPISSNYIYTITVIFLSSVAVHFLSEDKSNWLRIDLFFILGFAIVH